MRNYILTSIFFISFAIANNAFAQCNGNRCAVCNIEANIISSSGIIIENGTSTVNQINQDETKTGTEMIIEAVECGELEIEIEISYTWQAGNTQDAWLHGVSFGASQGWSSANGTPPGEGWAYYDEVTGFCSENTYYDGYFFDSNEDDDSSWSSFLNRCTNLGLSFYQEQNNFPGDNWGVPCHDPFEDSFPCPNFSFKLKYCPYEAGEANEFISFFFTNDGESGGWNDARDCNFEIVVPIKIKSAGVNVPELSLGPDCPGSCYELDAGEGCDGYAWSTGDTTQIITVCPIVSSEFKVSVSSACGPDIVGVYEVDVEVCCDAEVGSLALSPIDICSLDSVNIVSENYTSDIKYGHQIFIIENDTITENYELSNIDTLAYLFDPCQVYQLTIINYLKDSIPLLPGIGDSAIYINCNMANCCDRLDTILDLRDTIPPIFITMDQSADCNFGFPPLEYQLLDTCTIISTVSIDLISSERIDSISCPIIFERIFKATAFCGNESIDTQWIEFIPEPPNWIGNLPKDTTILCGDPVPQYQPLNYSNNSAAVMDCDISGFIIPDTIFQNDCDDGIQLNWTYKDACDNLLQHSINIHYEDSIVAYWELGPLNDTIIVSCIEDIPNAEAYNVIDNCKVILIDDFSSDGNAGTINLCEGGSFIRSWTYSDSCDSEVLIKNRTYIIEAPEIVSCDDGDPCTFNDLGVFNCEDNKCYCEGTPKPELEILGSLSFCNNASTILSVNGTGNILWSTLETSATIDVSSAGIFSVTVTDFDGCQKESSVMVREAQELSPNIIGDSIVCQGSLSDLSVAGIYDSIKWSNGFTDSLIVNLQGGTYSVTVYSGICIGTDEQTILERDTLNFEILGNPYFCYDSLTTLSLSAQFDSYIWSTSVESNSITVQDPGMYYVTVTDTLGCTKVDSFEVFEYDSLELNIVGNLEFCTGDSTILDAGQWQNYIWSTLDTTQEITVTDPGIYQVTIFDNNGCSKSTSVEIFENAKPNALIVGEDFFCEGDSLILESEGTHDTYLWNTQEITKELTIDQAGMYTITVYDGACFDIDSFEVFMIDRFDIDIVGSGDFCVGDTMQLSINGDYNKYQWSNLDTSKQISVFEYGDYSVTVTDQNGCTASSSLLVIALEEPEVEIVGATQICEGSEISLSVGVWSNVLWNNGEETSSIVVDQEGEYNVTVTDINGCTASTGTVITKSSLLVPEISGQNAFCEGESVSLNAGSGFEFYNWNTGDSTENIIVSQSAWYVVTVSDINQVCFGRDSFYVEEIPRLESTVIDIACADDLKSYTIVIETNAMRLVLGDSLEFGSGIHTIENLDTSKVASFVLFSDDDVCNQILEIDPPECNCELVIDLGVDLILDCSNDQFILSDKINNLNNDYDYLWTDIEGSFLSDQSTYAVSDTAIVILEISDKLTGCMVADTLVVKENKLAPNAEINSDPSSIINCYISEVNLSINNPQANINYIWVVNGQDSTVEQTITVVQESFIQLLAIDSDNSCFDIDSILVQNLSDFPLVSLEKPDTLSCNLLSVNIDGSNSQIGQGLSYQWLDEEFNEIIGETTPVYKADEAGLYYLQIIDSITGCSNLDSVMVFEDRDLPFVEAGDDIVWVCSDSSAFLSSVFSNDSNLEGYWSYEILNGQNINKDSLDLIEVFEEGIYYFQLMNIDNGCSAYDSLIISRSLNIPSYVESTIESPSCFGETNGSIQIQNTEGGNSPYMYTLIKVGIQEEIIASNDQFSDLDFGSYQLIVEDANGCFYDSLIMLEAPLDLMFEAEPNQITATIGDNATVTLNTNLTIDKIDTIIWTPKLEEACPNCLSIELTNLQEDVFYEILLIDINGCEVRTDLSIELEKEIDIYIPNIFDPNSKFGNDVFGPKTSLVDALITKMEIYDRWGNLVFLLEDTPLVDGIGWDGKFLNEYVANGVYVYSISISSSSQNETFVKMGDVTLIR